MLSTLRKSVTTWSRPRKSGITFPLLQRQKSPAQYLRHLVHRAALAALRIPQTINQPETPHLTDASRSCQPCSVALWAALQPSLPRLSSVSSFISPPSLGPPSAPACQSGPVLPSHLVSSRLVFISSPSSSFTFSSPRVRARYFQPHPCHLIRLLDLGSSVRQACLWNRATIGPLYHHAHRTCTLQILPVKGYQTLGTRVMNLFNSRVR